MGAKFLTIGVGGYREGRGEGCSDPRGRGIATETSIGAHVQLNRDTDGCIQSICRCGLVEIPIFTCSVS